MAMKVSNITIHRLIVDMSCGCRTYAEFEDVQCKKGISTTGDAPFDKVFKPCIKHEKDTALSMLEYLIGERLDEAVESAQAVPVRLHSNFNNQIEDGDSGGVLAVGSNVQTVARVNRPAAVTEAANRHRDPSAIKTIQRSPEQLKKAGATLRMEGLAEMQIDEVEEDENITPHIFDLLGKDDPTEFAVRGGEDDE